MHIVGLLWLECWTGITRGIYFAPTQLKQMAIGLFCDRLDGVNQKLETQWNPHLWNATRLKDDFHSLTQDIWDGNKEKQLFIIGIPNIKLVLTLDPDPCNPAPNIPANANKVQKVIKIYRTGVWQKCFSFPAPTWWNVCRSIIWHLSYSNRARSAKFTPKDGIALLSYLPGGDRWRDGTLRQINLSETPVFLRRSPIPPMLEAQPVQLS